MKGSEPLIIKKPKNFDLNQIYESGQVFRWKKLGDNEYLIPYADALCKVECNDTEIIIDNTNAYIPKYSWLHYFDLDRDYEEIEYEVYQTKDMYLIKCYEHAKGIRILKQNFWETLITFIISQNNNIPRIKKSVESICIGCHFPSESELSDMDLSDKGLGYREKYIKDACKKFSKIEYKLILNNGIYMDFRKDLKSIQGVGDKVADCVRLFGLHQLDAFPVDTHIKQVIDREYGGKMPEWVHNKFAGVFQQYIFYYEMKYKTQRN